jgi:hypothetical protein
MVIFLWNVRSEKYGFPLLCLLFIVILSGCASTPPPLNNHDKVPSLISPEAVLEEVAGSVGNILKAMTNIEVSHASGRYSTKAALLIKRPSSLRLEAIPIIGPVNLFLSVHEDVLKIFLPQKGVFYIGKATPQNLSHIANFFATGLRTEDLLSIMSGTYPRVREKNVSLRGSLEGKRYRVDMVAEDRKLQSMWVDLSNHHLVEVQVFNEHDRISYTARFEEFDTSSLPAMPLKITFISETDDHPKMIIRYSSIQLVTDVEAPVFDLQIPPGVDPIYLD